MPKYTQHTIRSLVDELRAWENREVQSITNPHSHRGDYSELAFEVVESMRVRASDLVQIVSACIGPEFQGWKGGMNRYSAFTAVCGAEKGHAGGPLAGPDENGDWVVVDLA